MDVYGFLFGRFAAGRRAYRQKCTVQTVGFISEVRRTGKVVQHVPQILILVNALDEEGNYFQTSLKRLVPGHQIPLLVPAAAVPIRYNPKNRAQAVFDRYPDAARIQELLDRHEYSKHPGSTPLEERREINRNGVDKKALLESLRLTGNEERGEREAEITIRFFSADRESSTARRRMYINDRVLENLAVGRYVNIRMVPEKKNLFAFVVPANHICPM